jgi:hypothetical protein
LPQWRNFSFKPLKGQRNDLADGAVVSLQTSRNRDFASWDADCILRRKITMSDADSRNVQRRKLMSKTG